MKKNNILKYLMLSVSIILCMPSIIYLIKNKTVDGYNSYYSYTLDKYQNQVSGALEGLIFIGAVIFFSIIYLIMLNKQVFKSKKSLAVFIIAISTLFTIMLPVLSSDIFYYIGDSYLSAKYNENPYYTTVKDLNQKGINDEILSNTGVWRETTSVYGPLWNFFAKILVSFSFGNVTIALYTFKLSALIVHILNCYIIYKITSNTKYVIMYGLNPAILIEALSNVHNDLYLIFMIQLAMYFLRNKKNIFFASIFLAFSIAIKYVTALLVPFILIYYFKDKNISKKIFFCFITGIFIILLVVIMYLPYYKDSSIYTNMLVQDFKFTQSIMTILLLSLDIKVFMIIYMLRIPIFLVIYVITLIILLLKKEIKFEKICNTWSIFMFVFIFLVITNYQSWYFLWMFPVVFFTSPKVKEFVLSRKHRINNSNVYLFCNGKWSSWFRYICFIYNVFSNCNVS